MTKNSTATTSAKSTLEITPEGTYDNMAWALAYASAGLSVFPLHTPVDGVCDCKDGKGCSNSGKHPRNAHGVSEATTDPKQIAEWWTRWPTANIGGSTTGLESRDSNFFTTVIDIDPRHGGDKTYQELIEKIGPPPLSPAISRTGNGQHGWFRVSVARGGTTNTLGTGIDTRAKGNYVVLPPSRHFNGGIYTWLAEQDSPVDALPDFTQIPNADEWLARARGHAVRTEAKSEAGPKPLDDGEGRNTMLFAHLDRYCRDEKQGRVTKKMLRAMAQAWDAENCKTSLGEKELSKIADSVFKRYQDRRDGKKVISPSKPSLIWMDTVTPRRLEYLIYPYLPLGVPSLMAGDAGEGKSYITMDWVGAVTSGRVPMSTTGELLKDGPANVLLMGTEDALDCTVHPRLHAAGADLKRVPYLQGVSTITDEGERVLDISLLDIDIIEETVQQVNPLLMVIDPITDFLGKTDMHRANEVGPILKRLGDLAQKHDCAILLIAHLSKGEQARPMHKVLGSIAFSTKVRSQMLVGHGPDDPNYHALIHTKANNTPTGTSNGYRIVVMNPDDPREEHVCQVKWTGPSPLKAEDLVAPQQAKRRESLQDQAEKFLIEQLSNGARPALEVDQAATRRGIAPRTLTRARVALGVESRPSGFGRGRVLSLSLDSPVEDQSELPMEKPNVV